MRSILCCAVLFLHLENIIINFHVLLIFAIFAFVKNLQNLIFINKVLCISLVDKRASRAPPGIFNETHFFRKQILSRKNKSMLKS